MTEIERDPLPCIVCGTQPEPAIPDKKDRRQPYGATMFWSTGNYGSTVFDSISHNQRIWVNVCDKCLVERKDRVWYTVYRSQPAIEAISTPWEPGDGS